MGSFQRGSTIRTESPLDAVWRQLERAGTQESLAKTVATRGLPEGQAAIASLRMRQAIDFWRASRGTSMLTRPVQLYYAMLNLTRVTLLVATTGFGAKSHGAQYLTDPVLMDTALRVGKAGTFADFLKQVGCPTDLNGQKLSLWSLLSQIPELRHEIGLLSDKPTSVATVRVRAFMEKPLRLGFQVPGLTNEEFERDWQTLFPWMASKCEIATDPMTLAVTGELRGTEAISDFCDKHLMADLRWRDDATWFDHVTRPDVVLLPRPAPYLGAMFILSNICRYEPELLSSVAGEMTDCGFALTSFLDSAERYYPQLLLNLLAGRMCFFV
jgi:hypothetical protein